MTKVLVSRLDGGAIGTNPTPATEPWASSAGGTVANGIYQAGIAGYPGQSIEVTGARDFVWNAPAPVGGVSHWRLGLAVNRLSGTQTAGQACMLLRSGTTSNRADAFLRNQNGGQFALRGGAGGTTFAGQSSVTIANGDVWWIEIEYDSDGTTHKVKLHLWAPGNTSGTPSDSFETTALGPVDNVRLFNPTGATGLTMRFGELWRSDGEQIREGDPAPVAGTVVFLTNVVPDGTTAIETSVKTVDAETVQLEVTPTGGGAPVLGAEVVPDEYGYAHPRVEGLTPDTSYSFRVLVDGVQRATGTNVWTLPPTGEPTSYRAGWGSCIDTPTSGVFALIANRGLRHFHFLGDDGYTNISNGPFGSISPTDEPTRLAQREVWLSNAYAGTRPLLWSAMAVFANYSDCDGAGGNADGTTGGHATGVVQTAFRRQYALPQLDLTEAACYVIPMGRVWEVHTDETADAHPKTAPDTEAKLKLGAAQQAWLFNVIDAAKAAGVAILWFGDGPIAEPAGAGGATGNSWAKYRANLLVVTAYAKASGVPFRRFHGDTHTLFLDDGTNGPNGVPSISAAPVHTTAQPFSYPTSGPKYPDATLHGARQYGVYEVQDDGDTISLEVWGYSSAAAAPNEVERFHAVYDITPRPAVERTAIGSLPLGGSPTRAIDSRRAADGSLPLGGAPTRAVGVKRAAVGMLNLSGAGVLGDSPITRSASGELRLGGRPSRLVNVARIAVGALALFGAPQRSVDVSRAAPGMLAVGGAGVLAGGDAIVDPEVRILTEIENAHTLTDIWTSRTLEDE